MNKGIKTILFATNLTQDCTKAFSSAVILALKFQAKIVILHVIEKIPDYVEGRLEGLLGEEAWNEIRQTHENEALQTLIGKRSTSKLICEALEHISIGAGIDEASCGYQAQEVVLGDGNAADSIIKHSKKHACDLIILGSRESRRQTKSIGATIKSVLQRSKTPVMVVPAENDGESYPLDDSGFSR